MSYQPSSHRLRIEEKRATRRLVFTVITLIAIVLGIVFIGLPALANLIAFSTPKTSKNTQAVKEDQVVLPPTLDYTPEATNSADFSISGYGNPEGKINLYRNNNKIDETRPGSDGHFIFADIKLIKGFNTFKATNLTKDKESNPSDEIQINYSIDAPQLNIEKPKDGDRFSSDRKQIIIEGLTDEGVRLSVNGRPLVVGANGSFSYPVSLKDGENKFELVAKNPAGNESKQTITVTYIP